MEFSKKTSTTGEQFILVRSLTVASVALPNLIIVGTQRIDSPLCVNGDAMEAVPNRGWHIAASSSATILSSFSFKLSFLPLGARAIVGHLFPLIFSIGFFGDSDCWKLNNETPTNNVIKDDMSASETLDR